MRRLAAIVVFWALPFSAQAGPPLDPTAQAAIMGRVFWDRDGDGRFSSGDEPLPGVRVLDSSGGAALTDERGRYHFDPVPAGFEVFGDRMLKLDPATLPAGATAPTGRFVSVSPGSIMVADFPVLLDDIEGPGLGAKDLAPRGSGLAPAEDGTVSIRWSAAIPAGCRLAIGDELLPGAGDVPVEKTLAIRPGANRFLAVLQCPEQRVWLYLLDFVWLQRRQGGDLIVPARPRPVGACRAPSANMPRAASTAVSCRLLEDVRLRMAGENFNGLGEGKLVPIEPGPNRWAVTVELTGEILSSRLDFDVSSTYFTGLVLGSFAAAVDGGSGSMSFGGKLDGWLEANLPKGFKLILGGNYYSYDIEGKSFIEALGDLALPVFSPWSRAHQPDLEDGFFEFGDGGSFFARNPSRSRYYLEISQKASSLGAGQFEIAKDAPGGAAAVHLFSLGVFAELHPVGWFFESSPVDVALEGFYGVPVPGGEQPLPPAEPDPGQLRPAPAHDEFLATGSTLYFLSRRWLSRGSLRLAVERRDRSSGAVLEARELVLNRDYWVDWDSGRVILSVPLDPGGALGDEALRIHPHGSLRSVLVADYEYLDVAPRLASRSVAGGRAGIDGRVGEGVRLGGAFFGLSSIEGDLNSDSYRLLSGEVFASFGKSARLRVSYGRSEGVLSEPAYSTDGGLSFHRPAPSGRDQGEAFAFDLDVNTEWLQGRAGLSRFLSGYSDSARWMNVDATLAWLDGRVALGRSASVFVRATGGEMAGGMRLFGTLGASWTGLRSLSLTAQAGFDLRRQDGEPLRMIGEGEGTRVLGALRARYRALPWLSLTAAHQQNLWKEGTGSSARDLTLSTAGVDVEGPSGLGLGLEGGFGPEVGNLVRLNLRRETDGVGTFLRADFLSNEGASGPRALSSGQSAPVGRGVLYRSNESFRLGSVQGISERLGLAMPVSDRLAADFFWERGEVAHPADPSARADLADAPFADRGVPSATAPGRRNAVFGALMWKDRALVLRATAEYRLDEHAPPPEGLFSSSLSSLRQTLFSLAGRFSPNPGWAISARAAFGEAFGEPAGGGNLTAMGGLLEASVGLAFRPESVSWLSLLARVSGGRDLRPELAREGRRAQIWWLGSLAMHLRPSRFFQPSLVLAPVWESQPVELLGGRRYLEEGSLLSMVRVSSEIWRGLGVSAEARARQGFGTDAAAEPLPGRGFALGGAAEAFYLLSSDSGDRVRLGVGYSFSDLPDPLSDLRRGAKGLFIRLEGML